MSFSKRFFLVILSLLWLTSCEENAPDWSKLDWRESKYEHSDKDIKLPKSLVERISQLYMSHMKSNPEERRKDEQIALYVPRDHFSLKLWIGASTPGVLTNNALILFQRGGGTVDFANLIGEKKGRFHVKIDVDPDSPPSPSDTKVYFVSEIKRRKIGREELGLGCNQVVDVTNYFFKYLMTGQQPIYSTDARHISLLGGTFVLVQLKDFRMKLSTLSFEDSRLPDLRCENLEGDELGS